MGYLDHKISENRLFLGAVRMLFLVVILIIFSVIDTGASSGPRDVDRNGIPDNCTGLGDIYGYKVGYPGNDSSYGPISGQTVYQNSGGPKLFSADARLNWGQGGVADRELTSIAWSDRYRDCGGAGYSTSCTTVVDTSTMSRPVGASTVDGAWTWQNGYTMWASQSGSTINFTDPYGNADSADITAWWPTTTANPYSFTGIPSCGTNHVSVSQLSNWITGSTLCYNDTSCHNNSPTLGDVVGGITVPAAGFADLWWHFWPRTPNNMTATCNPAGDQVTLTWTPPASAGVDSYYVRVNDPSNDGAGCPGGWLCNTTGEVASGQYPGTTYGPYAVIPGRTYTWWLHSTVWGYPSIYGNADAGPAFNCAIPPPPPPSGLNLSCSAGTVTANWTAPGGYNTFYLRANPGANNNTWPSAVVHDAVVGTSDTFSGTQGQTYYVWIHTRDPATGDWSRELVAQNVTCSLESPSITNVTISSPSVSANGSSQYTITHTATDPQGGGDIGTQYALVNYQGANAGQYRGYLGWSTQSFPTWSGSYKNPPIPCANGGSGAIYGGAGTDFGHAYINLLSCSTSVSGNTRTTSFVVTFNSNFISPASNNTLSGWAQDAAGNQAGWNPFGTFVLSPQPDYTTQGLAVSPGGLVAGQLVSFSATVINSVSSAAVVSSATRLRIDLNNDGTWDPVTFVNQSTGALASGATEAETWANAWTATAGTHKFEVCADIGAVISESNEGNNCTTQVFTVFNYSLLSSGNITVTRGSLGSNTILRNLLTSGNTQAVTLSATGLPAGSGASFTNNPCVPTCASDLIIATTGATPTGSFPITITGSGGGITRTTSFNLIVNAASGSYDFWLLSSGGIILTQGAPGSNSITATVITGSAQPVDFTVSGLPSGATAVFSGSPCTPAGPVPQNCSTDLAVSTTGATPAGNYNITVTGTSGGISRSTSFVLTVNPPSGGFDFSLSNDGPRGAIQGTTVTNPISANLLSGTAQTVTFSVSGAPAGVTATFSASNCDPDCSTTLTIVVGITTASGNYPITVTGVGGGLTRTTTFTLSVGDSFDFSMSNGGPKTVTDGYSVSNSITATFIKGVSAPVTFSVTSPAITGVSYNFTSNPCTPNPTCTATLNVVTSASTPLGTHNITVSGVAGSVTHTTSFVLTVINQTLSVSSPLGVSPNPADPNISRTITASRNPSSTALGTINYSFWWNCTNTSANVGTVSGACGSLPADPAGGGCTVNSAGAKCNGEAATSMATTYANYAIRSTAKVIMEQGTAPAAERRATVNVNLGGTCVAAPDRGSVVIDTIRWSALATGGSGTYTYTWSGSAPLNGRVTSPPNNYTDVVYTTYGNKTGSVTITDGFTSFGPVVCTNSPIYITGRFLGFDVMPKPIKSGQATTISWTTDQFPPNTCTLTDDNPQTHINGGQVPNSCVILGSPPCPSINLASTTVFTITCDGVSRTMLIDVEPPPAFREIPPP